MKDNIEKILQVKLKSCKLISQNSSAYIYNCDDKYLIKVSEDKRMLASETQMLEYLKDYSSLPVPSIIKKLDNFLITEYIKNNGLGKEEAELDAALKFATLHRIHDKQCGFITNTNIGIYEQSNRQNSSWIEFYKRERIFDFVNQMLVEDKIGDKLYDRVVSFCDDFDKYLVEPKKPSLLHGDIWSGNILINDGQISGIIDPAIYYGHHEMDLAFILMFQTFGNGFFERYNDLYPIEDGFLEQRADIYNLYPYLVHARAFGKSYLTYVKKIMEKYGY